MEVAIKIIGLFLILLAILYILKPSTQRPLMEFFKKGKRIYFAGLIRLVLAVVFLLAARQCDKPKVIAAFGILFLIAGLLVFVLGPAKSRPVLEWYQKKSLLFWRIMAVIPLILGALIIYSA